MEEHEHSGAEQHYPGDRSDWPSVNPQPVVKRRKFWRIGIAVLFLFLLLRESGLLGINLYVSSSSASSIASFSGLSGKEGEGPPFSVYLQLRQGKSVLMEQRVNNNGKPMIRIVAKFDDSLFQGNTWLPLYKQFSMEYYCPYRTVEGPRHLSDGYNGEIQGKIEVRIIGFCSHHQAHALALGEARKAIEKYLREKIIEGK